LSGKGAEVRSDSSANSLDRLTLEGVAGGEQFRSGQVFWLVGGPDALGLPTRRVLVRAVALRNRECSLPTYSGGAAPASHRLPFDRNGSSRQKAPGKPDNIMGGRLAGVKRRTLGFTAAAAPSKVRAVAR
jgi:hypothetical protein